MMKKLAMILTALVLFCGCASAESFMLGDSLQAVPADGWTGSADGEYVYLTETDTGKICALLWLDMGLTGEFDGKVILEGIRSNFQEDSRVSDISQTRETNGFFWFGYRQAGLKMAAAVEQNGKNMLLLVGDADICVKALGMLVPVEAATQAETISVASCEECAGFYDFYAGDEVDQDINLILTKDGHGRMINSTSSVPFDYTVQDGKAVDTENLGIVIEWQDENHAVASGSGFSFRFLRRGEADDPSGFRGTWKAVGMNANGMTYDRTVMKLIGISLEFDAWKDGSMTWRADTDSSSVVAMGWGTDDRGLYMKNGDSQYYIELNRNTAVFKYNGNTVTFERVK